MSDTQILVPVIVGLPNRILESIEIEFCQLLFIILSFDTNLEKKYVGIFKINYELNYKENKK